MEYTIDAKGVRPAIYPCPTDFSGTDPAGNHIDFTNYYMRYNKAPYFAASGEMHFSRVDPAYWEDEIIKMKMAGLTMLSTYLFWIHHEEEQGVFDWQGQKDLRCFLQLCKKQNVFVILRVGPFSHGECRNGGFPDWMYGAPYDVRSNDEEYLFYVRRYFLEIGRQAADFMFAKGGPIVSVQLENEYEHASSPWEMTTENSGEWTAVGSEGRSHFEKLKALALEAGLIAPLYSTTAWSGACAPEDIVMPLWGGYAYRPWIFYGDSVKEHPPTLEYIYRNFHDETVPPNYTFEAEYDPRDYPFVCCEMGGGMSCYYPYRFQLPYRSVEAMANVKAAGGCNFLGYYMYHGGTNPHGKKVPYLNECALPKMSYDYQAAIGEYGQLRESYHRSRLLHYLFKDFESVFCDTMPVLPAGADTLDPADTSALRYSARVNGGSGFLFLNNFQDHAEMPPRRDVAITVELPDGPLRVPATGGMSLATDASAVLPLQMDLGGVKLRYATAQPITCLQAGGENWWFFKAAEGMEVEFCFEAKSLAGCDAADCRIEEDLALCRVHTPAGSPGGQNTVLHLTAADGTKAHIYVLTAQDALRFWRVKRPQGDVAVLCGETLLEDAGRLRIESIGRKTGRIGVFPARRQMAVNGASYAAAAEDDAFSYFDITYGQGMVTLQWEDKSSKEKADASVLKRPVVGSPVTSTKITNARALLRLTPESFAGCKQVLVQVDYEGDIGYAYTDGVLINDNFANGAIWEFGIKRYEEAVLAKGLYIYVSPSKTGSKVNSDSEMAARFVQSESEHAQINDIRAVPVFDVETDL